MLLSDAIRNPIVGSANAAGFKKWFAGSVIVTQDGKPREVYHQTPWDAAKKIKSQGFKVSEVRNRRDDTEMPDGVFLKFTPDVLGVGGYDPVQLRLVVRATNPLRVMDRSDMRAWLVANSPEWTRLDMANQRAQRAWTSAFDAAWADRSLPFEQKSALLDEINEDGNEKVVAIMAQMRQAIGDALREHGYDSLWMRRDEGSRGRLVETLVVLDPSQVRLADKRSRPIGSANGTTARRTDPVLWEAVKAQVTAGDKGGRPGQWSARKAQLAVRLYKERGGEYLGPKSARNSLVRWTEQDWRTKSGKPSLETGERYLPAAAIESLTPAEYAATSRAKRAGMRKGVQFVDQPERIAEKVSRFRR